MKFINAVLLFACAFSLVSFAAAEKSVEENLAAIEAAVKSKQPSASSVTNMIALLKDSTSPIAVKERAAWGLGYVGKRNKQTVPALLTAAEHKGLLVRSAAVNSLIRLRAAQARPLLEKIAKTDPILSLRRDATLGLGLLESDQAIATLSELAVDTTPDIRGAAALAMSALQSKRDDFRQAFQDMMADDNPYVQERAQDALLIAQKKSEKVRALLVSDQQDVRLFAALYFMRHGTTADLKAVGDARDGEYDDDVRVVLIEAQTAIKKRAQAAAAKKKAEAAKKLSKETAQPTKKK